MTEFWDLYDKSKNKLGRLHERGLPLNSGEYHLVAEIWVVNSNKQILLTQRHLDKKWGGYWECSGGAVLAGEDSLTGAKRELYEETGLRIIDAQIEFLGTMINKDWITETYIVNLDALTYNLNLQDGEVINAKWVDIYEFRDMCARKVIVPATIQRFNLYKEKLNVCD
ncbi:NUDIX hydrolase [Alkaliphilus peptidifermentans]|uniref:NUDIX domain-containing protein n=1 Tax=Alkaliphilus peptidifermentans DSM 18978 TaxID=1120976 RepID=A0A1G5LD51_9FIRM|nr:NUDIX domain-containing protein [Alkaliphilus peptidifermentans]SCZ10847.1 NUDIX domain-containing protein [Alkaliphilus peptidifermentans DSM 18978]